MDGGQFRGEVSSRQRLADGVAIRLPSTLAKVFVFWQLWWYVELDLTRHHPQPQILAPSSHPACPSYRLRHNAYE